MKCKSCGQELESGARFCSHCGQKVEEEETESKGSEAVSNLEASDKKEKTEQDIEPSGFEDKSKEVIDEKRHTEVKTWYFVENNESKGPFSDSEMKELLANGRINASTFVWKDGFDDWKALNETNLQIYVHEEKKEMPRFEQEKTWFYVDDRSQQQGPFTAQEMKDFFVRNIIFSKTFVWSEGMEDWQRYETTPLYERPIYQEQPTMVYSQARTTSVPSHLQTKSVVSCILFTILTCGLYGIYWWYCLVKETNALLISQGRPSGTDPGLVIIFSILTCGFYGIYYQYKICKDLASMEFDEGYTCGDNSVICIVLSLFALSIVSYCIIQDSINGIIQNG